MAAHTSLCLSRLGLAVLAVSLAVQWSWGALVKQDGPMAMPTPVEHHHAIAQASSSGGTGEQIGDFAIGSKATSAATRKRLRKKKKHAPVAQHSQHPGAHKYKNIISLYFIN